MATVINTIANAKAAPLIASMGTKGDDDFVRHCFPREGETDENSSSLGAGTATPEGSMGAGARGATATMGDIGDMPTDAAGA